MSLIIRDISARYNLNLKNHKNLFLYINIYKLTLYFSGNNISIFFYLFLRFIFFN